MLPLLAQSQKPDSIILGQHYLKTLPHACSATASISDCRRTTHLPKAKCRTIGSLPCLRECSNIPRSIERGPVEATAVGGPGGGAGFAGVADAGGTFLAGSGSGQGIHECLLAPPAQFRAGYELVAVAGAGQAAMAQSAIQRQAGDYLGRTSGDCRPRTEWRAQSVLSIGLATWARRNPTWRFWMRRTLIGSTMSSASRERKPAPLR
jgi:hypothetical protein